MKLLVEDSCVFEQAISVIDFFDKLIELWCEKMHTVNRRLTGTVQIEEGNDKFEHILGRAKSEDGEIHLGAGKNIHFSKVILISPVSDDNPSRKIYQLTPKSSRYSEESYLYLEKIDALTCVFLCFTLDENEPPVIALPYQFQCIEVDTNCVKLAILIPDAKNAEEYWWTKDYAFPVLFKWFRTINLDRKMCRTNRLIDIRDYARTYRKMKNSIGRQLAEQWTEQTDPQKFVFEDCGIASYLLELWSIKGNRPSFFADLGCGNGLLVHLLNKSGVKGCGLDVRKRDIWSSLMASADLRESVVDPNAEGFGLPPNVDFLIGNHSDELTPWIPVMAARLNCNFMVIPCCPFGFYAKYNTKDKAEGQKGRMSIYESFLNFVRKIAQELGFDLEEDRLSIPSTKRICFVGTVPPNGLFCNVNEVIERLTKRKDNSADTQFVARPKQITNRNCSNIPREKQFEIAKKIFDVLLQSANPSTDGNWNPGIELPLAEVNEFLTEEDRNWMKAQNGGLQTFLKNQHQTFQVYGGTVRMRDWRRPVEPKRNPKKKKKEDEAAIAERRKAIPCFMDEWHPDGCPLSAEQCMYGHRKSDSNSC
ncbi:hypothetical protein WR25_12799 isoform C [Diploscapter pachys]|uniref:tRNA (uracil-O(2)-)-methyltransferase n=1 Tax=Diploscapter pachys TaxID=2018661 RepID=A0A2A2M209_9BILA|nr:hypothetical protein WR25_12799 isoform C [Diploscapter pachys]